MRVSDKMNQNQMLNNIQKNRSELNELQNQAATMKKINKPSDDPVGAAQVLRMRTENKNLEQFDKNISYAKMFLENSESTLGQLSDAIVRAKELALQGASDTNSGLPRAMISEEISQIYNAVVEMSNRRVGDRYMFGGYQTLEAPFTQEGEYLGDSGQIQIQNQKGHYLPMNISGSHVFLGENLGYDSSVKLMTEVPKTVEELRDYVISEETKGIQEKLFRDTQQQGQVDVRGPASVDRAQRVGGIGEGGAVVDPNADPGATDSTLNVVSQSTGVNLFQTMTELETALRADDTKGIQSTLGSLDKALNQINLARADIGGRLNQMTATSDGIQKSIVENKSQNSLTEDADLFKVMTDLSKSDSALKATLETSSKIAHQSLLDFLR